MTRDKSDRNINVYGVTPCFAHGHPLFIDQAIGEKILYHYYYYYHDLPA